MSKRVSITLHDEDEAVLAEFSDPSAPAHDVLKAWADSCGMRFDGSRSEAHFLRLLLHAGAASLREESLDVGYAALAESMTGADPEESAAMSRRYADRTDRHMSP